MSFYTFTPSTAYALGTHEVFITDDRLRIKLTYTGMFVYDEDYSNGIAFRCVNNSFEVGSIYASQVFTKQVDMDLRPAGLWIREQNNVTEFIGSNDRGDTSIYNIYNINKCPVQISKSGTNITEIKCPCDGTPCTNSCYRYGQS
jgi:hypothetical protein